MGLHLDINVAPQTPKYFFYSESKKYSYSDLPLWDFAFKRLYAVTLKFIVGVKGNRISL
jgi:hypothetical protein